MTKFLETTSSDGCPVLVSINKIDMILIHEDNGYQIRIESSDWTWVENFKQDYDAASTRFYEIKELLAE